MEPKYKVGQRVKYDNRTGIIRKVWTTNPDEPKYTVDFLPGKHILKETEITKA